MALNPIPIQELLWQLIETLDVLLADVSEQEAWAGGFRVHVPPEEMALEFYDEVPMWFDRMRSESVVDEQDEARLMDLRAFLLANQSRLFGSWLEPDATEWGTVRELAGAARTGLLRWRTESPA